MTEAGRATLPDMDAEFVMSEDIWQILEADSVLHAQFSHFPALYQRVRLSSIQREYKKSDDYGRMLKNFVATTKEGVMYGSWTDYGWLYP